MLVLDDLGFDKLGFYGATPPTCAPSSCLPPPDCLPPQTGCVGPYAATPNLDLLRSQGILFTRAYANPICSATRACIQTGKYSFRTGVGSLTNTLTAPGDFNLSSEEKLLAELVREGLQGGAVGLPYRCGAFGKWHLTTSLAQDYDHAVENGYQRFYGTMGNLANHFRYDKVEHDAGSAPALVSVDGRNTVPPFGTDTWSASVTTRDALAWINAQHNSFLAYVAFAPPHAPLQVPPAALLPAATLCELECAGLVPGDFVSAPADPPETLRLVHRALIEALDTEIGNLLDGLSPAQRANTMVFVIGDNGTLADLVDPPHDPTHAKLSVYELGVRVPLIVSGPLVKQPIPAGGWQSDALVSAVDLWLTIADVTGANAAQVVTPGDLDSQSFLSVIRDPLSPGSRTSVFSQIYTPNGVQPLPPPSCFSVNRRSLSDGEYKYVRVQQSKAATPCGTPLYVEELYHLPTDPEETVDLLQGSLTPEEAARLAALSAEMDALSGM